MWHLSFREGKKNVFFFWCETVKVCWLWLLEIRRFLLMVAASWFFFSRQWVSLCIVLACDHPMFATPDFSVSPMRVCFCCSLSLTATGLFVPQIYGSPHTHTRSRNLMDTFFSPICCVRLGFGRQHIEKCVGLHTVRNVVNKRKTNKDNGISKIKFYSFA